MFLLASAYSHLNPPLEEAYPSVTIESGGLVKHRYQVCTRFTEDRSSGDLGESNSGFVVDKKVELGRVAEETADIRWSRRHSHTTPGQNTDPPGL